jgi:hypothetical protein
MAVFCSASWALMAVFCSASWLATRALTAPISVRPVAVALSVAQGGHHG